MSTELPRCCCKLLPPDRRSVAPPAPCSGFAVGLVLTASNPVPFLLALAGMAIGATLAQGVPEPAESRADRERLSELEPPADPAPAWLPDPLGGDHERLWDGEAWTRHVWRRAMSAATVVPRGSFGRVPRLHDALAGEQAALRRVATLVASEAPDAELFAAVAESMGALLDADQAELNRYEPDGCVTIVATWAAAARRSRRARAGRRRGGRGEHRAARSRAASRRCGSTTGRGAGPDRRGGARRSASAPRSAARSSSPAGCGAT